ncbi:hypothetical protein, conserved [Eimeria acervulina]|uniref:Uncharacterized protein n=1 Tax=Eimeria acervulina TaxID=5801 RepID=U6GF54_EIMAC|nr:hypothetical protein, conserved [Eimeria acervulina]CDI78800.1 hypothetical protein, conserved [Eimeria acervulina]
MGSSHSTNQSINCGLVDGDTTSEFCRSGSADDETTLPNFASSEGTSEGSETNDPPQKLPCVDQTHSRHSAILIFDLDDTLIPTEWIRSSFAVQKHKHATTDEVYQAIRGELERLTSNKLTPFILNTLKRAKKWSETVVIVTNARSVRWLSAMKSLFPEVVQLLQDENIPIIRSCPTGEEPSIHEAPAYFSYWMNAKKTKFLEVIRNHLQVNCISPRRTVDLISIGDNDFEEYAALRAAHELPNVRLAKVVKCRSGLEPLPFLHREKENPLTLAHDQPEAALGKGVPAVLPMLQHFSRCWVLSPHRRFWHCEDLETQWSSLRVLQLVELRDSRTMHQLPIDTRRIILAFWSLLTFLLSDAERKR